MQQLRELFNCLRLPGPARVTSAEDLERRVVTLEAEIKEISHAVEVLTSGMSLTAEGIHLLVDLSNRMIPSPDLTGEPYHR